MYIYLKWYNMNLNYNYKGSQYKKNKTYLSNQIMFFIGSVKNKNYHDTVSNQEYN